MNFKFWNNNNDVINKLPRIISMLLFAVGINTINLGYHEKKTNNRNPELPTVNFFTSMGFKNINKASFQPAELAYNKYMIKNVYYACSPRIPKIIHQIWLGSSFPEGYKRYQETWIKNHPDWKYILWTDKSIEEFGLENLSLYNQTRNYGEKSDIARYEILYRMGGLYVDTDFECFKPFDIFHHCLDFYMGLYRNQLIVNNALIGSIPGHPILKACIDKLRTVNINLNSPAYQTLSTTGPYLISKIFLSNINKEVVGRCVAFPAGYFYPLPPQERKSNREKIQKKIRPETYAIHYWDVAWNNGIAP